MTASGPIKEGPLTLREALEKEYTELHSLSEPEYPKDADENARLAMLIQAVHALKQKRSALCLSGGGIRSATFNLGLIQGLAGKGMLGQFDYLSTVSGGGYVGGWLSAWIKRHKEGMEGVVRELSESKMEPDPISHLRAFSNYLSPRLGLFSADTWTLVATFLRNMFLNWMILLPMLAAALMLPRFFAAAAFYPSPPTYLLDITLWLGFFFGVAAVVYVGLDLPSTGNRWHNQNAFLFCFLLPLALTSISLSVHWAWCRNAEISHTLKEFIFFAVGIHSFGWLLSLLLRINSGKLNLKKAVVSIAVAGLTGVFGGSFAYWAANELFFNPNNNSGLYVSFAPPALMAVLLMVGLIFVGLMSKVTDDEDREWWARSTAWMLIFMVVWIAGSMLVVFGPVFLLSPVLPGYMRGAIASFGGILGIITAILGYSSRSSWEAGDDGKQPFSKKAAFMALPITFTVIILILLSACTTWILKDFALPLEAVDHAYLIQSAGLYKLALVFGCMTGLALITGFFVHVNKFSLHAMYRNRLIRAYMGASNTDRRPHPFTGFDEKDNIYMRDLPKRPLHVVNTTLNLVESPELAWQQRKAEPFSITRLHAGNARLGYRPSDEFGGGHRSSVSLGTAMAISGAAASPNMGYHSSPLVTFLMALFNVRLGWWLGNPAKSTWKNKGPWFSVGPLMAETFGLTNDKSRYVYLSDGGHFENLGLYEMVLRRCHFIVLSDSSCDSGMTFDDLGNALRKIRIDLGIPIDIDLAPIKTGKKHCAIGTIHYESADGKDAVTGYLIYIKPSRCGKEPPDVLNYAEANPEFPHQATTDQWFNESQFESYRMLGLHSLEEICGGTGKGQTLDDFVRVAEDYMRKPEDLERLREMK